MKEFYALLDHVKGLYDSGLYEDVKILSDLLIAMTESSASTPQNFFPAASTSTSFLTSSTQNSTSFQCDLKDKYTLLCLYGNAAFNLREYKTAESFFNKALQINKSNLKSKTKNLNNLVAFNLKFKILYFYSF